ncbi:Dos2-interacting transcription regulator of RNA-Pol-II-domain-containing protein [Chytriomyces sp. MP71]|nr:Dos2-interacting transcription regulator of RNA-Pol-II-domain-containing protein [Chytriomyces sp. MP71]
MDFAPYLDDPTSAGGLETVSRTAGQIASGEVSLVGVVEALNAVLTSGDPFERAKGVALLSSLLSDAAFEWNGAEYEKKKTELLTGIHSLVKSGLAARADVIELARSIFAEINNQNFAQNVRFSLYCVFEALLNVHLEAMKYLGDKFIAGFLVAMDGEKDPRNILISFGIVQIIILNFDIQKKFEDIFESIYCYFPITFRPPPNDPYGITSADLKLKLRLCFASSPLFGPLAWPILIEKLTSTSDNAKLDALETIAVCAPIYGGDSIGRHIEQIWDLLYEESLESKPEVQRVSALKAITSITYALSTSASTGGKTASSISRDNLTKFLTFVTKHVQTDLVDSNTPRESVRKVLHAAAKATEPAFFYLASQLMQHLVEGVTGSSISKENRCEIYNAFRDFLVVAQTFYGSSSDMDTDSRPENPLLKYKVELFQNFQAALSFKNDSRVMIAGLDGLFELSAMNGFMTSLELEWYFETLLGMSINEEAQVRHAILSLLSKEAVRRPETVKAVIVPQLLEACALASAAEEVFLNSFEAIVELSAETDVLLVVVPAFIKFLEESDNVRLVKHTVTALQVIFTEQTSIVGDFDYYASLFVPSIRALLTRRIGSRYLYENETLVESVASTYSAVMRLLDSKSQERLVALSLKSLYLGDFSGFGITDKVVPVPIDAVLVGVDTRQLLQFLISSLVNDGASAGVDEAYVNSMTQTIASILNKIDAKLVADSTNDFKFLFNLVEQDVAASSARHLIAVTALLWTIRASFMRSPTAAELENVSRVIALLQHGENVVASKFYILAADDPSFGKGILSKASFAKSALLWKQKLFKHCMPILVEKFTTSNDNVIKSNNLLALSHLMKYVSKSVILYEIQNLIPLLLAGLASANAQLNLTVLEIVQTLLTDSPGALKAQIESFIGALLHLIGGDLGKSASPSVDVRIMALTCLGIIPGADLPFNELIVLKPKVIRGLHTALDDTKKAVRKEAGNARAKWYLLLSPKK